MVTSDDAGFHRFEWVKGSIPDKDRLARSSSPNYKGKDSDQDLTEKSIKFLQENNIEHVISLNSLANDETIAKKLRENNIAYTPLPVQDYHAPTLDELSKGNQEYRKHRAGTLVWCGFGHGRTGTMVSALQIYAERDEASPKRLSGNDYTKNHVESDCQREVLNTLQDSR